MTLAFGFQSPAAEDDYPKFAKPLRAAGFSWMEVTPGDSSNSTLIEATNKVRTEFDYHISVHSRYLGIDLSNPYTAIRRAALGLTEKDLRFAFAVHAERFVVHGGNTGWFDDIPDCYPESKKSNEIQSNCHARQLEALRQSLFELSKKNRDPGLNIVLENLYCPWELINDPSELAAVFAGDSLKDIGFILDFGHAAVSGHSPAEFVHNQVRPVSQVHLHDNDSLYDLHRPIKSLSPEWKFALEELEEHTEEIPVVLEWRAQTPGEYVESMHQIK